MKPSIGFIGGGRITRIFLEAMRRSNISFSSTIVSDPSADILTDLKKQFAVSITGTDNTQPASCDIVVLSLHPPVIAAVLEQIKSHVKPDAIVLSLAPKWKIGILSGKLGGFTRIVRMIPNAPSIIGKGYNPVTFSEALTQTDKDVLQPIFHSLGECPPVNESTLEAYAILAAMGPTYFLFQLVELERLGMSFGLTSEAAQKALGAMLGGTKEMFYNSGLSKEVVMDFVPVKPLCDDEETIRVIYRNRLEPLYKKLTA